MFTQLLFHFLAFLYCAVIGCANNTRKLQKLKETICEEHVCQEKGNCACQPPYQLFCFPSENRYISNRLEWTKRMRREKPDKTEWLLRPSDRVCSEHFVDGEPICNNPYPTLKLGYDFKQGASRRELFRRPYQPIKRKKCMLSLITSPVPCSSPMSVSEDESVCEVSALPDHNSYSQPVNVVPCLSCCDKNELIKSLCRKVTSMSLEMRKIMHRQEILKIRTTIFSWNKIKTDRKMLFYTGLPSKSAFNTVFSLIEPSLPNMSYWRGTKTATFIATHLLKNMAGNFKL